MRELEFLPTWYPVLRRKQRFLIAQAWAALAIVCAFGVALLVSVHRVHATEEILNSKHNALAASDSQLQKLNELQSLKIRMSRQVALMSHIGPDIPMARILSTLEEVLPAGMALRNVSAHFESAGTTPSYVVTVHGVSPSGVELGTFLTRLARAIPHWVGDPTSMAESNIRAYGHLMLEFTFSFRIQPADAGAGQK